MVLTDEPVKLFQPPRLHGQGVQARPVFQESFLRSLAASKVLSAKYSLAAGSPFSLPRRINTFLADLMTRVAVGNRLLVNVFKLRAVD